MRLLPRHWWAAPQIAVPLIAIAVIAAACGSSDSSTEPDSGTGSAQAPEETLRAPVTTESATTTTGEAETAITHAVADQSASPAQRAAEELPGAVEGILLEGMTPEGFDELRTGGNVPRVEICAGVPAFAEPKPVAYSSSDWAVDALTGPFLDAVIVRYESPEAAAEAMASYSAGLVECGEFTDFVTGTLGQFTIEGPLDAGDEGVETSFAGTVSGVSVTRIGAVVREGDSMYLAGIASIFVPPDPAAFAQLLDVLIGM